MMMMMTLMAKQAQELENPIRAASKESFIKMTDLPSLPRSKQRHWENDCDYQVGIEQQTNNSTHGVGLDVIEKIWVKLIWSGSMSWLVSPANSNYQKLRHRIWLAHVERRGIPSLPFLPQLTSAKWNDGLRLLTDTKCAERKKKISLFNL